MRFNINDQVSNIEGKMMGLVQQLEKLAPHPSRPDHKGPLFVQVDSAAKPSSDYDGMMGQMIFESMLGTAFASAVSETFGEIAASADWSNTADAASAYIQDRSHHASSYQIGQRHTISGGFNTMAANDDLMAAYLKDLPRRMGLERWLAHYQRKLFSLRKQAMQYAAPALAA